MVPYQIIQHKRNGAELKTAELSAFFNGYSADEVPDYEMSALLMAIYFQGLSHDELWTLTDIMLRSGKRLEFADIAGRKVDKHSTGGVGDKISIILAPLVSSLGVTVPMISGRGLGHTGGTLDKLETIPGLRTDLTLDQFRAQVRKIGCAMIGQTAEIAPLDKRLYALRDVTATVESIPLIASSIMSKKIAEGIDALVLDIKRGSGAFLPDLERALELAQTMIAIGQFYNLEVVALLTAMDRPLGFAVGNALEMEESILVLRGEGPSDIRELTIVEAAEMLRLGGVAASVGEGRKLAGKALDDGSALEQMRRIIEAQSGNPAVLDDPALLPQASVQRVLHAPSNGYIQEVNALKVGQAAVRLGAGRGTLDARVDPGVGYHITAKPGQRIEKDEPLASVYASSADGAAHALAELFDAITIADEPPPRPLPLVSHRVTSAGVEEL
jgi:pyrimidine-nucleoside phosphorylase